MILTIPYQALEISNIHLTPFQPDKYGKAIAYLSYKDSIDFQDEFKLQLDDGSLIPEKDIICDLEILDYINGDENNIIESFGNNYII